MSQGLFSLQNAIHFRDILYFFLPFSTAPIRTLTPSKPHSVLFCRLSLGKKV